MKDLLIIILSIVIFFLHSCESNKDEISFVSNKSEILSTHIIDVKCGGNFLPLRKRVLTKNELILSNNNSEEGKRLNDELIIDKLNNGEWVKLLKADTLGFHYIQVISRINNEEMNEQSNIRGFIAAKYCNNPTLKKMEVNRISNFDTLNQSALNKIDFLNNHAPQGNLLDYGFAYISNEADLIQLLSFNFDGINEIRYKFYQVLWFHDSFLYSGSAELQNRYINSNGEVIARYVTRNMMRIDFEIHLNEDNETAFIKTENGTEEVPIGIFEGLILEKIK